MTFNVQNNGSDNGTWMSYIVDTVGTTTKHYVGTIKLDNYSSVGTYIHLGNIPSTATVTISNMKLELGSHATDYSLNPSEILTKGEAGSDGASDKYTGVKEVTQAEYDALTTKDPNTIYYIWLS